MRGTQTGLQLIRCNVQPCQLQLMGRHHVSLTFSLTSLLKGLLDQPIKDLSRSLPALYIYIIRAAAAAALMTAILCRDNKQERRVTFHRI